MAAPVADRICSTSHCKNNMVALGFCRKHYAMVVRTRPEVVEKERARHQSPKFKATKLAWSRNNRHKVSDHHRHRNYGLSHDDIERLFIKQEGQCAICRGSLVRFGKTGMHVDHDHSTQRVRGLLCSHCNRGLGGFKDRIEILRAAATYLGGN